MSDFEGEHNLSTASCLLVALTTQNSLEYRRLRDCGLNRGYRVLQAESQFRLPVDALALTDVAKKHLT
jgi:hypothetical protein